MRLTLSDEWELATDIMKREDIVVAGVGRYGPWGFRPSIVLTRSPYTDGLDSWVREVLSSTKEAWPTFRLIDAISGELPSGLPAVSALATFTANTINVTQSHVLLVEDDTAYNLVMTCATGEYPIYAGHFESAASSLEVGS